MSSCNFHRITELTIETIPVSFPLFLILKIISKITVQIALTSDLGWEEVAERYTIVQCYIVVAPRPRIHRWELIQAHRPHIRFVSITCGINPIYYGNIVELICKCIIINGLAHLDRMTYPLTPRFVSIVGGVTLLYMYL